MGEPRSNVRDEKTLEIIKTIEEGLKNMDKDKRLCQHRAVKRHDQGINNRMKRYSDSH